MKNLDFEWLTDEFMLYCRSTQLREKTMSSYEQTLHLFGRWLSDELKIYTVDKITENVIRKYIDDLMVRGKYTFYVNDLSKKKNCPDRRRDYRKPVSVIFILLALAHLIFTTLLMFKVGICAASLRSI